MSDTRRICDVTAAELLEAVIASLRMDADEWDISIRAVDGRPRRVKGVLAAAGPFGSSFGYDQLSKMRL